jgi:hypothetical protein
MSDIIKWLSELSPEGKKLIIKMLSVDDVRETVFDSGFSYSKRKVSNYHRAYGKRFKEIYDCITCSGKPIRGSGIKLTHVEFGKVVAKSHLYAKEQRELGYPDGR